MEELGGWVALVSGAFGDSARNDLDGHTPSPPRHPTGVAAGCLGGEGVWLSRSF